MTARRIFVKSQIAICFAILEDIPFSYLPSHQLKLEF